MSFAERLRVARLGLGLTQEQLAFELNVTKSTVSAWENGRDAPGFRLLPALKTVLGVSLDHLICGDNAYGSGVSEPHPNYNAQVRNDTEAALLKAYRRLPAKRRDGLLQLLD
jgi:transcriptional regulator with XRE-family HTH domain